MCDPNEEDPDLAKVYYHIRKKRNEISVKSVTLKHKPSHGKHWQFLSKFFASFYNPPCQPSMLKSCALALLTLTKRDSILHKTGRSVKLSNVVVMYSIIIQ